MPIRPSEDELLARLKWFVKLRWLFLLGLAAVLFSAVRFFHLKMAIIPIVIVAGLVLIYNTAFYLYHRLVRDKKGRDFALKGLRVESNLQIGSDLLALVFLVHFTLFCLANRKPIKVYSVIFTLFQLFEQEVYNTFRQKDHSRQIVLEY